MRDHRHEIAALQQLATEELAKIAKLTPPVVRVCGPLTCDGPAGYSKHAERLAQAAAILAKKGMRVWTCEQAEKEMYAQGYRHEDIMTHFHQPILESGLITTTYFLPRWEESPGASWERRVAMLHGVDIHEFPEIWLDAP